MSTTDDQELDTWDQSKSREFRWTDGLPWAAFLAVAWIVFELTAEPALTAGVFCLKFAWKDSAVGLWLFRCDSRRARGWSCLLFYLASAGWKAMMAGILVTLLFVFVGGGGPQAAGRELAVTMSVAAAGFAACCLIGVLGIMIAWRGKVRIWLDSNVYWSYRDSAWPPTIYGAENKIRRVLIVTQLVGLLFGTIGLMLLTLVIWKRVGGELAGWIMLAGIVIVALFVLWLPERIDARIIARFPLECWPDALPQRDSRTTT